MKKLVFSLILFVTISVVFIVTSANNKDTLLFLNWGEYIDETLIDAFEEKYNCTVLMDIGESNEIFYARAKGATTVYDVICPSDYMVEKLYVNDLLEEIDFDNENMKDVKEKLQDEKLSVQKIYKQMNDNLASKFDDYVDGTINKYAVPYLSGTWGIMYTTLKEGLEDAVTKSENQWASLFDRSILPDNTKVAMYDSHQHAYFAVCKYLKDIENIDYSMEQSQKILDKIEDTIKAMNYNAWGTDSIKKDIVAGNLDLGFMWTGDFLYYYAEQAARVAMDAYLAGDADINNIKEVIDILTSDERIYKNGDKEYQIGFDFFIPDDTIAFCDNLVIPKDSANKDLAYKFINFMSSDEAYIDDDDPETVVNPAFANTYYVDYDAPYVGLFNQLVELKDTEFTEDDEADFEENVSSEDEAYDSDLYWLFYDYVIGIAFDKYYGLDSTKGDILQMFDRKYINKINTTFNNARV